MPGRHCSEVLAVLMLLLSAGSLAAAGTPAPGARLTEAQAKARAGAFAQVLAVHWDETAAATRSGRTWAVRCHGCTTTVREDTGRVATFSPPRFRPVPEVAHPTSQEQTDSVTSGRERATPSGPSRVQDARATTGREVWLWRKPGLAVLPVALMA